MVRVPGTIRGHIFGQILYNHLARRGRRKTIGVHPNRWICREQERPPQDRNEGRSVAIHGHSFVAGVLYERSHATNSTLLYERLATKVSNPGIRRDAVENTRLPGFVSYSAHSLDNDPV